MRCRRSTDSNVVTGGVLRLRPSHRRPLTAATTDQLCASSPRQRPERRATVRNVPGTRSELYRSERSVTRLILVLEGLRRLLVCARGSVVPVVPDL